MARPVKWRRIEAYPRYPLFSPMGQGAKGTGENRLKVEELEAVRLKDLEGLEQEECAARMEVSRPTFQRILVSARAKIANSLVHGKSIRIEGGNYTQGICPVRCLDCGRIWEESIERMREEDATDPAVCPSCQSTHLVCCPEEAQRPKGLSPECQINCCGRGRGPHGGFRGNRRGQGQRGPKR